MSEQNAQFCDLLPVWNPCFFVSTLHLLNFRTIFYLKVNTRLSMSFVLQSHWSTDCSLEDFVPISNFLMLQLFELIQNYVPNSLSPSHRYYQQCHFFSVFDLFLAFDEFTQAKNQLFWIIFLRSPVPKQLIMNLTIIFIVYL